MGVGKESLPMPNRYAVDLTPDERDELLALTRKGKASARRVT
jgi:hypothetical protein